MLVPRLLVLSSGSPKAFFLTSKQTPQLPHAYSRNYPLLTAQQGLNAACCITGNACPANASDYYTSIPSTAPPAATTTLPVAVSTSIEASTTSTKKPTSTVSVITTPLTTTAGAPPTAKTTSSVVTEISTTSKAGVGTVTPTGTTSTTSSEGFTQVSAGSGAQERRILVGLEGFAMGALGVVGFVAGLI